MDIDTDQPVEDNAKSGKRKRSPNTRPHTPQDWRSQDTQEHPTDVARKANVKATPKRSRIDPDILLSDLHPSENPVLQSTHGGSLSFLPVEVLDHILSLVDPFTLGRLMCTTKYFRDLLDPKQAHALPSGIPTRLPLLVADSIWTYSRQSHLPDIPHPFKHMTELDMLRLLYGRSCQKCGKLPKPLTTNMPPKPWNSGPGPEGVRAIWSFKIRTCADCLRPLLKETQLVPLWLTQIPAALFSASFTPSLNYVMSVTLTQKPAPPKLKLTKYYFQPQVEEILRDAPPEKDMHGGAYRAWLDDLTATGQDAHADIVRFETWEYSQIAAAEHLAPPPNINSRSSASGSSVHSDNRTVSYFTTSSGGNRHLGHMSNRSGVASSTMSGTFTRPGFALQVPQPRSGSIHGDYAQFVPQLPRSSPVQRSDFFGSISDQSNHYLDPARMKAHRRADIIHRCAELMPPLGPAVLEQLPAFRSAVEVPVPLDETSWTTLKIQLLGQKDMLDALDTRNRDSVPRSDTMDTSTVWRPSTPDAEPIEEDPIQRAYRPVRDKLLDYGREYVYRHYAGGTGLTPESAPQFAADVLLYVRARFYEHQEQEDAAFVACGQLPPAESHSGVRTRVLELAHMKYVFDNCVKPYTEFVRKDLFMCSGCDMGDRRLAFEAIIQHFASKHTNDFSRGQQVVYWKAVWPAQPPFEPAPGKYSSATNNIPQQSSSSQVPPIGGMLRVADFVLGVSRSGEYLENERGNIVNTASANRSRDNSRRGSLYTIDRAEGGHSPYSTDTPTRRMEVPPLYQHVPRHNYRELIEDPVMSQWPPVGQRDHMNRQYLPLNREHSAPPAQRAALVREHGFPVTAQDLPSAQATNSARDAARFLESVDVPRARYEYKDLARPVQVDQYPRHLSMVEVEPREDSFRRRPNISQPRSHVYVPLDHDDRPITRLSVPESAEHYDIQHRTSQWTPMDDHHRWSTYDAQTIIPEHREVRYMTPPVPYNRSYEEIHPSPDETQPQARRHYEQMGRHLDHYGREAGVLSRERFDYREPMEINRTYHPEPHEEAGYERIRREPQSYTETRPTYDPRPAEEYYAASYIAGPERSRPRDIAHEYDMQYVSPTSRRPPMDDRHYDRR